MSKSKNQTPAPQWEAKKKNPNDGKIFTISDGNVQPIDIKTIYEYKKNFEKPIGKVYSIEKPESMLKKDREPQTKLWYYDKRNYARRTEDIKLDLDDENKSNYIPLKIPKGESYCTIESISKSLKFYRFN